MLSLLEMSEKFYALLPFKEDFDSNSVESSITELIESDLGSVWIDKGCMLGAMIYPAWMSNSSLIATELFWWSENPSSSLNLLKKFEEWGISKGATYLHMIRLESKEPNRLDKLYQRRGYRALEHVYFKEV